MAGAETSASGDPLDKLVISIRSRVEEQSPPSECCIFTIPERLRETNKEAYKPRVVAIGPYHHDDPSLMPMEDHKLWYLQNFLQHNQKCDLKDYIKGIKSWEDEARKCYDKQIDLNSDQFTEMMLLDGIFIIQLFLINSEPWSMLSGDRIFDKPYMIDDVPSDMALLENQMPFFAIQRLFDMAFGMQQREPVLLKLACSFFKSVMKIKRLPAEVMESGVKHFVHMIRLSFLPLEMKVSNESSEEMKFSLSVTELVAAGVKPRRGVKHFIHMIMLSFLPLGMKVSNESSEEMKFSPSVTELVAAGVKLRKGESACLLDIEFENGVLKIPYLALDDSTKSYFQNLIAFEQFYHQNDRYLTDYMAFMVYLVNIPADAKLLIDKKIIENWLSNKEAVMQLINSFSKETTLSKNYYFKSLSHKLINHCEKPYNKWKADFKRDYCSSPWVVISVTAAVVLLLLTIAQTVCSVRSAK